MKKGNISIRASERDGKFGDFDLQGTTRLKVKPETSESNQYYISQYNILLDLWHSYLGCLNLKFSWGKKSENTVETTNQNISLNC